MLPLTYLQSGFMTDSTPAWFYPRLEDKRRRALAIATQFSGAEVLNHDVDTETGRGDVRDLSEAMRLAGNELGRPFIGFWSFPRLPGFFRRSDIASQPDSYRAYSLKADGSLWRRLPSPVESNESRIKFTGEIVDITHEHAVNELLANVARVFRADGPVSECVGPLHGFIVLNETMLSSNYESVWGEHEEEHDVPGGADARMRLQERTHHDLFTDDDPHYSYLNPPKRCVPLFSENAAAVFSAYARERGVSVRGLPADRNEFLDRDGDVSLPPWVAFVPPEEAAVWRVWEEWVYETWFSFLNRICREWCLAQEGNERFLGVLYFQLPMWYSLPRASREPLTFAAVESDGRRRDGTWILRDHPEYARLNPVVMGTDMEMFMESPWLAGAVHESTKSIHVRGGSDLSQAEFDEFVMAHPRFLHYYIAQGALLRRVCRRNGKLFGAFARAQYFRGSAALDSPGFRRSFERTIAVLEPDIVATIGPWFVDSAALPEELASAGRGGSGELAEAWGECMEGLRGP
jgi:hypothetical protein